MQALNNPFSISRLKSVVFFIGALVFYSLINPVSSHAATLKIATLSPDGSVWMKKMRDGAKQIKQLTKGRIKFKFYPGGVMGNDSTVLRKIRIGQLQGGAVTGGSLAKFYPDSQVYNLPLVFKNKEEVDYVRSKMDEHIVNGLEDGGFISFGLAEGGFAYILSNTPIDSLNTLREQKVWIPANDKNALVAVDAFNVNPIPLPISDVLTGLQTHLIDTVATSPIAALAFQWHTQVKYIVDTPVIYFYGLLAISNKAFKKISSEDQQTIRSVMGQVFKDIDAQNKADNQEAIKVLQDQHIEMVQLGDSEKNLFETLAQQAINKLVASGSISQNILNRLNNHLEEFRTSNY